MDGRLNGRPGRGMGGAYSEETDRAMRDEPTRKSLELITWTY